MNFGEEVKVHDYSSAAGVQFADVVAHARYDEGDTTYIDYEGHVLPISHSIPPYLYLSPILFHPIFTYLPFNSSLSLPISHSIPPYLYLSPILFLPIFTYPPFYSSLYLPISHSIPPYLCSLPHSIPPYHYLYPILFIHIFLSFPLYYSLSHLNISNLMPYNNFSIKINQYILVFHKL